MHGDLRGLLNTASLSFHTRHCLKTGLLSVQQTSFYEVESLPNNGKINGLRCKDQFVKNAYAQPSLISLAALVRHRPPMGACSLPKFAGCSTAENPRILLYRMTRKKPKKPQVALADVYY